MGSPAECHCHCSPIDSSRSSASSIDSSVTDSSYSTSSPEGGCAACCPVVPVEFSLWWPGVGSGDVTRVTWDCVDGSLCRYYYIPRRGTYRLRKDANNCEWLWLDNSDSRLPAWKLNLNCQMDGGLVITLSGYFRTFVPYPHLGGVYEQTLPASTDGERCIGPFTLPHKLGDPAWNINCQMCVPPYPQQMTFVTPASISVWPS